MNPTIVKYVDNACYRLRYICHTVKKVTAPLQLLVTFELAAVTVTRGLGRQSVSRRSFSHLESVAQSKKVGGKVWGVASCGGEQSLHTVAFWMSAQLHHLVRKNKFWR